MNYIDLFAGAGGLSEGFKRAGFNPIAHVEMNSHACNTIKTRMAYYHLKDNNKENIYLEYLKQNIDQKTLWESVPNEILKPSKTFFLKLIILKKVKMLI